MRPHRDVIDFLDVVHDIHIELRALIRVEVHHVAERPVSERGAEHGDVVLVGPVVHRVLVVDLLAQAVDHRRRGPACAVGDLLVGHGVQDGVDPILEQAVVLVGHQQVAQAVHTFLTQLFAV